MTAATSYIPTKELVLFAHIGELSFDVAASTSIISGTMVGIDASGNLLEAAATGVKVIVGRASKDVDNSAGVAGALTANVQPGIFWWKNGDTITKANIGDYAYVSDNRTVVKAGVQGGVAGVIVAVDSALGVAVASMFPFQKSTSPNIQAGTTTLVAGTKTVTGVNLTTTSRIFLTMKDPGAGALTEMCALDAPDASRDEAAGSFVINCIDDTSNAVITTAIPTVDYLIVG